MALVSDEMVATINMQKVGPFKFPLAIFNYESGPNSQTYYTTWMMYALIIETNYEKLAENRTRVTTTYAIGYPRWLKWTFPLIRKVLTRNYHDLMSTDIPMRERRGQLRSWGYSFACPTERYSFEKTMAVYDTNVIPPLDHSINSEFLLDIAKFLPQDGEYFYGKDDHLGLRIVRNGNQIKLYLRMCPHEGASLDKQPCVNEKVKCPWHGRLHAPLANFDLASSNKQAIQTSSYLITLINNQLHIKPCTISQSEPMCTAFSLANSDK